MQKLTQENAETKARVCILAPRNLLGRAAGLDITGCSWSHLSFSSGSVGFWTQLRSPQSFCRSCGSWTELGSPRFLCMSLGSGCSGGHLILSAELSEASQCMTLHTPQGTGSCCLVLHVVLHQARRRLMETVAGIKYWPCLTE